MRNHQILSTKKKSNLMRMRTVVSLCLLTLLFSSLPTTPTTSNCTSSSCGNLRNITYPFRLTTDPTICGNHTITCRHNTTPFLQLDTNWYRVKEISYPRKTIRLLDLDLAFGACPVTGYSLPTTGGLYVSEFCYTSVTFVNCSVSVVDDPGYLPVPCNVRNSDESESSTRLYCIVGTELVDDLHPRCSVAASAWVENVSVANGGAVTGPWSLTVVRHLLRTGFELSWSGDGLCRNKECCYGNHSFFNPSNPSGSNSKSKWGNDIVYIIITRSSFALIFLFALVVILIYRRHLSVIDTKDILSNPQRYSYMDIKKMTNNFKEKLGQGGFGSVFKGKLLTGRHVAVKMLRNCKQNGEEFINEVSTIGRIHHLNVVQLIGFCSEGSRNALIYEFMSNGSLEKYIFTDDERSRALSWEKLYEIAVGVAHGIEYLHKGCWMRILHLDIKPHNILLDEDWNPKISDFGLAKLCPIDHSIMSFSTARGTAGYMAPEVFLRDYGGVSYKSDVYSFGMLLLEMAGRRKNVNPHVDRSSQIYYPTWVYDQLTQGRRDLEISNEEISNEGEVEFDISKNLAIIGLWCIQMIPTNRPSMSKVIEMLEEDSEALHLPPKPFLASPERELRQDVSSSEAECEAEFSALLAYSQTED